MASPIVQFTVRTEEAERRAQRKRRLIVTGWAVAAVLIPSPVWTAVHLFAR